MALIVCPECGKEVSDRASVCVHCGYPLASQECQLFSEDSDRSSFSTMLKGIAIFEIIAGILIALILLATAKEPDGGLFFGIILATGAAAALLFGFASIIDDIRSIKNRIASLSLGKCDAAGKSSPAVRSTDVQIEKTEPEIDQTQQVESETVQTGSDGQLRYAPIPAGAISIKCPYCGTIQSTERTSCYKCKVLFLPH